MKKCLWLLLLIIIAVSVWSHQELNKSQINVVFPESQKSDASDSGDGLEQKVLSFQIDGRTPNGVKQWHLEGTSAELVDDKVHLNNLKAVAYSDDAAVNLISKRGIYSKDAGTVELIGDVHVVSDKGFSLDTERASWSQITKEIVTDAVVYINGEGIFAKGTGGMANSDDKKAALNKDVEVVIEPDTKVNCDGSLNISYDTNTAIFLDNVRVEDKDGKLFSDKLTVFINPETKKLAKVIAEGNVKIRKGKSYTISEKAIYTESTRHAQLLGRPRVIIDPEEIDKLDNMENFH